jgi:hypothetical protein
LKNPSSGLPPIFKLLVLEEVEELNPRLVFHHLLKGIRGGCQLFRFMIV